MIYVSKFYISHVPTVKKNSTFLQAIFNKKEKIHVYPY